MLSPVFSYCRSLIILTLVGLSICTQAQDKSLIARYITTEINLDGVLDEAEWATADIASDFSQFFPSDSLPATYQTEIQIMYNDVALFVAAKAYAPDGDFVVETLKRDFSGTRNDNVTIMFDTFNDGTNAFGFGVTPYGVRREVFISNGANDRGDFNMTWDIKWQAESKMYDDSYTIEMRIPLSSLKFEDGATRWRFRPYRFDLQSQEWTTWIRLPQTQLFANLAYMGDLIFEKPLGKSRTPIAVIPYANGITQREFETGFSESKITVGGDAKIAIGDGLNLDLTANPDFSNVEVDDIFTNLTRFEIILPERRQFFIDNSDLFSSFGNYFNEARPFFSRRIGLARDTADNLIQNRIIGGARLSGKLNKDWRIGLLNIQTAADSINDIASNNNMMIAVQRKIGNRSNLGAFIVNRQNLGDMELSEENDPYNRVVGLDYNLASSDNVWNGRFYLHKSLQPEDQAGNFSSQAVMTYNKNNWVVTSDWVYVDEDFKADLGFVPRTDIFKVGHMAQRFIFSENSNIINRHTIGFTFFNYWRPNQNFALADNTLILNYDIAFKNQSRFNSAIRREYIYLYSEFDPSRSDDGIPLAADTEYRFGSFVLSYSSNPAKLFTYRVNTGAGTFFNGQRYSAGGNVSYRFQPWVQLGLNVNYDAIRLPEPHSDADLWLITPRFDVTFSKSIFWTTQLQYSNQRDNLGINSRLQWRFAPLSDLFLVYNNNYTVEDWGPHFRSLNLKVSYWLNL